MTSPLPPRLRDTRTLVDRVRQDRANLKQLYPGFVGGRFAPARRLGSATQLGDIEDDTEGDEETAAIAFCNTDTATATTAGRVSLNLTYEPVEGSLHLYWNGVALAPTEYILNGQTITFADHLVFAGDRLHAAYAYYPSDAVPPPPPIVFRAASFNIDSWTMPAGTHDGDFCLAIGVLPNGADVSALNGYEFLGESPTVTHAAMTGTYTYRLGLWGMVKPIGSSPVPTLAPTAAQSVCQMVTFSGASQLLGAEFSTVGDSTTADSPFFSPRTDLRVYAAIANNATLTAAAGTVLNSTPGFDVSILSTAGAFTETVSASTNAGKLAGWMLAGVMLG